MFMFRLALRFVLLLIALWLLPVLLIRAQPYHDRATPALVSDTCLMPCFLRIRPGTMTMSEAVALVGAHEWVANGPLGFPALIRDAVQFGSIVPRTLVDLRWTDALPAWIDAAQTGILLVEDQRVLELRVATHLSAGEIRLALGEPDAVWFNRSGPQHFAYSTWYADLGLFITGQGQCPTRHYREFTVEVVFRPDTPQVFEAVNEQEVC